LLLTHRGRTQLTQQQLASRVGVNRRSLQDWEAGVSYPTGQRLLALIAALLEANSMTAGHETEEAEALWDTVLREATRMHAQFDHAWFTGLLAERAGARPAVERHQHWGEAPDVLGFVGRTEELETLQGWLLEERCRLVAVLGMGGIGKTIIAAKLAQNAATRFHSIYWRGLRNAPPLQELMADMIGFLSGQQVVPPEGEEKQLAALLHLLRDQMNLIVLDNFETLLEPGQSEGRYRDGLAGYGTLLRAIGETGHQSCVVLTSREAPPELAALTGPSVRGFQLGGLGIPESQRLLAHKELQGTEDEWANLIARLGGNGLALKVVGESIREVFGNHIGAFLDEPAVGSLFGGVRRLLGEQIERSSPLEQDLLQVLTIAREPVTLGQLMSELGRVVGRGSVLEALEALRRRSLVERAEATGIAAFTLQSVVLEYVTDRLVEGVSLEIEHGQPGLMVRYGLVQAQARDYVRQSQERLIGQAVLHRLIASIGSSGAELRLLDLLERWRDREPVEQGYGPGNVVNLLRLLRGELRGLNLSHLFIRQAYLQEVEAQDATLAAVHLSEAVLPGAFNDPMSAALNADGTLLVTGTSAGQVCLWRTADRTLLLAVQGHTGLIRSVALSEDGRLLASGGSEGTVRLWQAPSGRLLATLQGHTGAVSCVALSGDGRLVASGGIDGAVRVVDVSGGQLVAALEGHSGAVYGVALSRDGRLLASGGFDGMVRLWESASGRLLATLTGHSGAVVGVALSGDGRLVASSSADGTARLWDGESGRLFATLQGPADPVSDVALSGDGRLLVSGSEDGTARLWDAESGRLLATLQGHTGLVWSVALSGDGRLVASGSADGTAKLWDAESGRLLTTLLGHTSGVYGVALSGDGRLVASGSADGMARLWDAESGRLLVSRQAHAGAVWSMALREDARLVASAGTDGAVKLWDVESGRLLTTLKGHAGVIRGVALSGDGRLLASGGFDGTARLWDAESGRPLVSLQAHTSGVYAVALSGDGRRLASGSEDGTVKLWEARTGRELVALRHTGQVWGVALSGDGRLLASGSSDGSARLWDAESGRLLAILQGHAGGIYSVALSRDARLLASGHADGTTRLWGAVGGQLIASLEGHTSAVRAVALSRDGGLVASGSFDGTVRLWQTSTRACLRTLRGDRRFERMDITDLTGVTEAQRATLFALGATEWSGRPTAHY
jgi:WD40 repeat protein/DNA-binding XRE family transcriptional regulator